MTQSLPMSPALSLTVHPVPNSYACFYTPAVLSYHVSCSLASVFIGTVPSVWTVLSLLIRETLFYPSAAANMSLQSISLPQTYVLHHPTITFIKLFSHYLFPYWSTPLGRDFSEVQSGVFFALVFSMSMLWHLGVTPYLFIGWK